MWCESTWSTRAPARNSIRTMSTYPKYAACTQSRHSNQSIAKYCTCKLTSRNTFPNPDTLYSTYIPKIQLSIFGSTVHSDCEMNRIVSNHICNCKPVLAHPNARIRLRLSVRDFEPRRDEMQSHYDPRIALGSSSSTLTTLFCSNGKHN